MNSPIKASRFALASLPIRKAHRSGSVSQDVTGFEGGVGKWYRFSFRGLADSGFVVKDNGLFMKVDFFGDKGANPLDGVTRQLYPLVAKDRTELAVNGIRHQNGGAVWKTYSLDFRLPFNEIDLLRLSVGFSGGASNSTRDSSFYVTEFSLAPIPTPESAPKIVKKAQGFEISTKDLIHLGGRWYYEPEPGTTEKPATLTITSKNADRLLLLRRPSDQSLRREHDRLAPQGLHGPRTAKSLNQDRFVPDNVVIEFADDKTMIVHARNIAEPSDRPVSRRRLGGRRRNPSYIQEHDYTYYLPLNPVRQPEGRSRWTSNNSNRALANGRDRASRSTAWSSTTRSTPA